MLAHLDYTVTSVNHFMDMSGPAQSPTVIQSSQPVGLKYVQYHSDKEATYLSAIRQLISKDLSEPYSIYVYRYFLYQWGDLCFLVSPNRASV